MNVTYLDHMGTDLTVVNAARVSFAKKSRWADGRSDAEDYSRDQQGTPRAIYPDDVRLIGYLAREGHWSPFSHPQISLHMRLPIFVARQIVKHDVGFSKGPESLPDMPLNEVSRRYVDSEPDFYRVEGWRQRAKTAKQGSSDLIVENVQLDQDLFYETMQAVYQSLIEDGVCPEQARAVLPQSTYTEFWMTGSLFGWARLFRQRSDPHAQKETQEVARQIGRVIDPLFPISWGELVRARD